MNASDANPDEIASLTVTLGQPRERETMHRRKGAFVVTAGGVRQVLELPFGATRLVGGRHSAADIAIDDSSVSLQHFELGFDGPELMLRDLGSRNGTWINSIRLESVALPLGVPFVAGRVPIVVERVTEVERPMSAEHRFGELVGTSPQMRELFALLARVAPTAIDVLVRGETGTGKELVARAIHQHSARARGPFIVLDCSSLPAELAESEINGHRKGAFTGATSDHAGCFEAAHGGTIFLDEIGELPLELQPKLLRVLERREVRRIGETEPRPADVRVVAATHRDLRAMVADGRFREDLYFRLASFPIELPPLRSRRDDITTLSEFFVATYAAEAGANRELGRDAIERLAAHSWPGNVRELRDVIKVAALLCPVPTISAADLRLDARTILPGTGLAAPAADGKPSARPLAFEQAKLRWTREYFVQLLGYTDGNVSEAARLAEIDRRQVQRWTSRLGLK